MQVHARLTLPLAAILLAVLAPAASGAIRVGPPSLATANLTNEPCATPVCTYVQYSDNGAAPAYITPVSGVITRWQLASGSAGNPVKLRVLRPGDTTGLFSGLGTGLARTTEAGLNTFTGERLQVQAGDSIGLDDAQGLFVAQGLAGAVVKWWSPALGDAAGASAPTNTSTAGHGIQLHADVEPDADGDLFGDETQDGCPGDISRNAPPCATGPVNPIRPVVTKLKASPTSLPIGGRTSISFRISRVSRWTLRFAQARKGRIRNGRCRLEAGSVRSGRRCTLYTSRGTVSGNGGPGKVTLIFRGSLANRRSLPPGRYRLTATAKNADGTSNAPHTALRLRPRLERRATV